MLGLNLFSFGFGFSIFGFLYGLIVTVQGILGYGTAYRLTKANGDNGLALWGWLFVMNLAALIPGLGIWLYIKHKDTGERDKPPKYVFGQQEEQ